MNAGGDHGGTSVERFMAEIKAIAAKPGGETELLLTTLEPHAAEMLRRAAISHGFNAELLRVLD